MCTKCGQEKELERFVRQTGKYRTDLYRRDCKDCKNEERRKRNAVLGKVPYRIPKGNIPWNKGLPADPKVIEKLRLSHLGKEPPNKGVRTSERRFSRKYKEWSNGVRLRDGKCLKCGSEEKLHAHHIKPWKASEDLRFDINNGMTLCQPCHAKIEGYQKGHRQSDEARIKMSLAKKGKAPWNKGLKNHGTSTQYGNIYNGSVDSL